MRCYCSICRKTVEGGGYAINDGALSDTLEGEENLYVYNARLYSSTTAGLLTRRRPARQSALLRAVRELPVALLSELPRAGTPLHTSTIVNPLPKPSECDHIMLDYAASWCEIPLGLAERHFPKYPDESFADWHRRHDLRDDPEDDRGSR
jgi:hypothetical protein